MSPQNPLNVENVQSIQERLKNINEMLQNNELDDAQKEIEAVQRQLYSVVSSLNSMKAHLADNPEGASIDNFSNNDYQILMDKFKQYPNIQQQNQITENEENQPGAVENSELSESIGTCNNYIKKLKTPIEELNTMLGPKTESESRTLENKNIVKWKGIDVKTLKWN